MDDDEDEKKGLEQGGDAFIKDDAHAFVVLGAAVIAQMIMYGLLFCFGVYNVVLHQYFYCTYQEVTMIAAITYGMKCLLGPLSNVLATRWGSRPVVITGGIISSIGVFISYFAGSIRHLYVSYGLINGLGFGLAYTASLAVLPDYFDKYAHFATGFAMIGGAIGSLLFQPIFMFLIDTYGWHGSMIVNAGIALQIVVCGCVLKSRTVRKHTKLSEMFEISLMRNFKFLLFCINCFTWAGGSVVVFAMVNSLAIEQGIPTHQTPLLAMAMGGGNVIGRLFSPVIGHFHCLNRPLMFTLYIGIFTIATVTSSVATTFNEFCINLAVFGTFYGAMNGQLAPVIIDVFGTGRLVSGFAYAVFFNGIGGILIPHIAGMIADDTGRVVDAYYAGAICFFIAFASAAAVTCIHKWQQHHTAALTQKPSQVALIKNDLNDKERDNLFC